jgi:hypothetical protein
MILYETHDPLRSSWVESASGSDFPAQNSPLSVSSKPGRIAEPSPAADQASLSA